jgi:hypothetical protein
VCHAHVHRLLAPQHLVALVTDQPWIRLVRHCLQVGRS